MVPKFQIRAEYNDVTVRVYQAYSPVIATAAVVAQTFVPPFSTTRMTWIKPSFLWMMYRSAWGLKEGQERVLAIDIARGGFEWALKRGVLSTYEAHKFETKQEWTQALKVSPVRIQWDPERNENLAPLPWRAIQIGLRGEAVRLYVNEWIERITDITKVVHEMKAELDEGKAGGLLLPDERPYPLPPEIAMQIGAQHERDR